MYIEIGLCRGLLHLVSMISNSNVFLFSIGKTLEDQSKAKLCCVSDYFAPVKYSLPWPYKCSPDVDDEEVMTGDQIYSPKP